jgi:diacylglycerol kinase (ATP)
VRVPLERSLWLSAEAQSVVLSVNPTAGRRVPREAVQRLAALLRRAAMHVEICAHLDELPHGLERARRRSAVRALVGFGGDGTLAELVNRVGGTVPLAIFPTGTENLLARYVGLRPDPLAFCELIRAGRAARLDAGQVRYADMQGNSCQRLFVLVMGLGFDAEVIRRAAHIRRGHIGHLHYVRPIWDSIRHYGYPPYRFSPLPADDAATPTGCRHCAAEDRLAASFFGRIGFVFNLPCYARGIPLAPHADGCDALLDVCSFARGSLWHGLRYLLAVMMRRADHLSDCVKGRIRAARIEPAEPHRPVPFQLDGDPGGTLPAEVCVLPGCWTLLLPTGAPGHGGTGK